MGNALFVVGRSGSGKTTVCKKLEEFGFSLTSASAHLKNLYLIEFRLTPSRVELADYGKMLLHEDQLKKFHLSLETEIVSQNAVCVDGLRFKLSVEELSKVARRSLLIFLSCPSDVRKSRSGAQANESEFEILCSHETEVSVDAMRGSADLILDTSRPISVVLPELEKELRRLKFI